MIIRSLEFMVSDNQEAKLIRLSRPTKASRFKHKSQALFAKKAREKISRDLEKF